MKVFVFGLIARLARFGSVITITLTPLSGPVQVLWSGVIWCSRQVTSHRGINLGGGCVLHPDTLKVLIPSAPRTLRTLLAIRPPAQRTISSFANFTNLSAINVVGWALRGSAPIKN